MVLMTLFFFFTHTPTTEIYTYSHTLPLDESLPFCKCNRVAIMVSRFFSEVDISRRIRVGASDDANINFEGFVAKVFFTVELQQFYDVILCGIIHPSPA